MNTKRNIIIYSFERTYYLQNLRQLVLDRTPQARVSRKLVWHSEFGRTHRQMTRMVYLHQTWWTSN